MMKSLHVWKCLLCVIGFGAAELVLSATNDQKSFALTIPFIGHDLFRGEFNLFSKAALAVEWAEWGGPSSRQELMPSELKKDPKASFVTEGKNLSIMIGKYSNTTRMSGFNWGVGAGYRDVNGLWKKTPSRSDTPLTLVDDNGKVLHNINMQGPTASGRVGYRHVGDSWGFVAGAFLGMRKFFPKISDVGGVENGYTPLTVADRKSLENRMQTKFQLGLELGWAW